MVTRVLVIDDHVLFAEAMRATLASDGLNVLRRHAVDVVLLDNRLPDTTGFDGPGRSQNSRRMRPW